MRGLVGIEALADRLLREFVAADGSAGEALLTLTDFLIVLHEVDYQPSEGALSKAEFETVFRDFLKGLALKLGEGARACRDRVSADLLDFWDRVVERCVA